MDLFKENDVYKVILGTDRDDWLKNRKLGIGASESSTLIGKNKYKSNTELWREKMDVVKSKELKSEAIIHGILFEPILREYFSKTFSEYDVFYKENATLQSKKDEWMLYSPDGLLMHPEKGKGILEIKTTTIQKKQMLENWNERIPDNYYIQCLHALLVTNFDYVELFAEIRFAWNERIELRRYKFTREEVKEDLEWLYQEEKKQWNTYYETGIEPPLIIDL